MSWYPHLYANISVNKTRNKTITVGQIHPHTYTSGIRKQKLVAMLENRPPRHTVR